MPQIIPDFNPSVTADHSQNAIFKSNANHDSEVSILIHFTCPTPNQHFGIEEVYQVFKVINDDCGLFSLVDTGSRGPMFR